MEFAFVAGEKSGDMLAASVLSALNGLRPNTNSWGIGGAAMQAEGFQARASSEELAVRGYVEVLSAYPKLVRLRNRIASDLIREKPSLFVGVDAPDFNLDLERRVRAKGVRTAHFISPSIWAWRGSRIDKIREAAGHMLVMFPFEQELYRKAKIPATFVGHPLADVVPLSPDVKQARQVFDLNDRQTAICVMPGSRLSEITYNAATFIQTAKRMNSLRADMVFLIPAANATIKYRLERIALGLLGKPEQRSIDLRIIDGQSHACMQAANGVLVASGTATLEVALFKKPMVIAYKMNPVSFAIMKPMAYLPYIGLPNILCGEFIVPEFVQGNAKPDVLSEAMFRQLDDDAHLERIAERFTVLHSQLKRGCGLKAAEILLELAGDKTILNRRYA